jgi:hypothetical protein
MDLPMAANLLRAALTSRSGTEHASAVSHSSQAQASILG